MNRIAFQGEKGAYSEKAAIGFFGEDVELKACASFMDVFESVENDDCTVAVLPIENTLAGSVHQNYDLLLKRDL